MSPLLRENGRTPAAYCSPCGRELGGSSKERAACSQSLHISHRKERLDPSLLPDYIMRNAGLEETQAGIKIARRNINNLRYADDTTLTAESEELKSLLMKVKKENEKVGLKLKIQKAKIVASGPITSWQIDGEPVETVANFILGGLQNHCRW